MLPNILLFSIHWVLEFERQFLWFFYSSYVPRLWILDFGVFLYSNHHFWLFDFRCCGFLTFLILSNRCGRPKILAHWGIAVGRIPPRMRYNHSIRPPLSSFGIRTRGKVLIEECLMFWYNLMRYWGLHVIWACSYNLTAVMGCFEFETFRQSWSWTYLAFLKPKEQILLISWLICRVCLQLKLSKKSRRDIWRWKLSNFLENPRLLSPNNPGKSTANEFLKQYCGRHLLRMDDGADRVVLHRLRCIAFSASLLNIFV